MVTPLKSVSGPENVIATVKGCFALQLLHRRAVHLRKALCRLHPMAIVSEDILRMTLSPSSWRTLQLTPSPSWCKFFKNSNLRAEGSLIRGLVNVVDQKRSTIGGKSGHLKIYPRDMDMVGAQVNITRATRGGVLC